MSGLLPPVRQHAQVLASNGQTQQARRMGPIDERLLPDLGALGRLRVLRAGQNREV